MTAKTLQEEYGIDFASCVGSLLYLSYTRPDITYAVVKFAKYTRLPVVFHMEALLHLLREVLERQHLFGIEVPFGYCHESHHLIVVKQWNESLWIILMHFH